MFYLNPEQMEIFLKSASQRLARESWKNLKWSIILKGLF